MPRDPATNRTASDPDASRRAARNSSTGSRSPRRPSRRTARPRASTTTNTTNAMTRTGSATTTRSIDALPDTVVRPTCTQATTVETTRVMTSKRLTARLVWRLGDANVRAPITPADTDANSERDPDRQRNVHPRQATEIVGSGRTEPARSGDGQEHPDRTPDDRHCAELTRDSCTPSSANVHPRSRAAGTPFVVARPGTHQRRSRRRTRSTTPSARADASGPASCATAASTPTSCRTHRRRAQAHVAPVRGQLLHRCAERSGSHERPSSCTALDPEEPADRRTSVGIDSSGERHRTTPGSPLSSSVASSVSTSSKFG